jgi:hypothetical protein
MPGEDHDTPAMMMFSGTERGSECGRKREDYGRAVTRDGPDRLVSGTVTVMTAISRHGPPACAHQGDRPGDPGDGSVGRSSEPPRDRRVWTHERCSRNTVYRNIYPGLRHARCGAIPVTSHLAGPNLGPGAGGLLHATEPCSRCNRERWPWSRSRARSELNAPPTGSGGPGRRHWHAPVACLRDLRGRVNEGRNDPDGQLQSVGSSPLAPTSPSPLAAAPRNGARAPTPFGVSSSWARKRTPPWCPQ